MYTRKLYIRNNKIAILIKMQFWLLWWWKLVYTYYIRTLDVEYKNLYTNHHSDIKNRCFKFYNKYLRNQRHIKGNELYSNPAHNNYGHLWGNILYKLPSLFWWKTWKIYIWKLEWLLLWLENTTKQIKNWSKWVTQNSQCVIPFIQIRMEKL